MPRIPLSLVDFCTIGAAERPADAIARSVTIARTAETLGYHRIWYAEHHNFHSIASSAPAVLIAHIAAHTNHIRLGAGGIMLPNHTPYTIAEQFGTLAEMHPGRIDLGLGRAPGTDPLTLQALRRDPRAADNFPNDVQELIGFLSDTTPTHGVKAIPGHGTHVPLYILGSSLFGAELAAALGLPFAFASHFAPAALTDALHTYRTQFRPSATTPHPYVIVAVNATAADTSTQAHAIAHHAIGRQTAAMAFKTRDVTPEQINAAMNSPLGQRAQAMMSIHAIGTGEHVAEYLTDLATRVTADELIVATRASNTETYLRSLEILASAWGLEPPENLPG
ncbi:Limonene 1,2-monooxygenase [Dermatophilus congolensis]|uniref:Limonene 1,2-monooxygenase n=1 Tax=Dermatophilus congolensis TaxID=1863 RepID=A0AA46BMR6_9MICO|nr:LLM class flavin-dependent oxidoreductase [Dermatophilus congolensis]STD08034.1 Limonene 1,2-monooxygenase [Dermatophilus congolensis]